MFNTLNQAEYWNREKIFSSEYFSQLNKLFLIPNDR